MTGVVLQRLTEFHLMVTNLAMCRQLTERAPPQGRLWSVFLKIDCGNARAGVWWEDGEAVEVVRFLQGRENVRFQGIYTHCGNSYAADSVREVERVRDDTLEAMVRLVERLKKEGLDCPTWGVGSTPSCSHKTERFSSVTELHPGNYVLYDNQQLLLGSCTQADIAGKVMTRVIGRRLPVVTILLLRPALYQATIPGGIRCWWTVASLPSLSKARAVRVCPP